jgi:hypothetical protein
MVAGAVLELAHQQDGARQLLCGWRLRWAPRLPTSLPGMYVHVAMLPSGRRAKPTQVPTGTFCLTNLVACPGFSANRGAKPVTFTAAQQRAPHAGSSAQLATHEEG